MHDALAPFVLAAGLTDWLPEDWTFQTAYSVCAIIGALVLVVQFGLSLVGMGDADGLDAADGLDGADGLDADHGSGLPLLSVRAVTSALLIFGLVGMAGTSSGWPSTVTLVVAILSGLTVLVIVAWVMTLYSKLDSSGTMDPNAAVGTVGRVYLRVPSAGGGKGKITVEIQGRSVEYDAYTNGAELPTGTAVRVVRMTAPAYFEVVAIDADPQ